VMLRARTFHRSHNSRSTGELLYKERDATVRGYDAHRGGGGS